jgi:hypothetical protein
MNWEAIGAVGETVGALAVLVTLVYLAVQIQQNTKAVQAAAVDSANSHVSKIREAIIADADVANIFRRGSQDPASLSEDDAIRYRLLIHNIMLALSNSITQASVSGLSKSKAQVELSVLGRVVATAGGRWFWKVYRHDFEELFRGMIDDLYLDIYDERPQDV